MKKTHKKVVLIDTQDWLNYTHEDYIDYMRVDNDDDFTEVDIREDKFFDWCMDERELDIESFFDNIKWSKVNYPLLVTGCLGLWDGKHEIYAERFDSTNYDKLYNGEWGYKTPSIESAIRKCIGNCDDFEIFTENGVVNVYAHHHDGTNCFEIRKLSKKGEKASQSALDRFEYLVPKDYWFAKIPDDYLF